jgi:beta-lactamase regulating signal transducer with metallopeptidase domain
MIAEWMLYSVLCTAGLAVAATLAEHALISGRRPVRHVWIGAVALSLVVPALAFRFAAAPAAPSIAATGAIPEMSVTEVGTALPPAPTSSLQIDWNSMFARADQPLTVAWVALSSTLLLYLVGGIVALAWLRRTWQRRVVLGVPVLVSEQTGPALVGVVSPSIVVPEWSLALEPTQLALMLRHEEEHRQAGDGQLLTAAQLALIVMPWNVALWWTLGRLRLAVELDCDARVLRDANARSYGDLLLEVARPRRGLRLIGATAFAERATQLERRIRVMARHRATAMRGARVTALSIGVAAISVAWVAPHPSAPARVPPLPVSPRMEVPEITLRVNAVFDRLFDGIALTPRKANRARETITALVVAQIAQDQTTQQTLAAILHKRAAIIAQRDSALMALISNDADRALFISRVSSVTPGARGRSMSAGTDSAGYGRRGRAGGGGRGSMDATYSRLLDGISLTPEQEASARDVIEQTQRALLRVFPVLEPVRLTMFSASTPVIMQAESQSALEALVGTEADRQTLRSRIVVPAIRSSQP